MRQSLFLVCALLMLSIQLSSQILTLGDCEDRYNEDIYLSLQKDSGFKVYTMNKPETLSKADSVKILLIYYSNEHPVIENIERFQNLVCLHIIGPFSEIPDEVFNITTIKDLYLSDLKITEFEELFLKISQLPNLTSLQINNLGLKELPSSLFKMTQLETLIVENCKLKKVSPLINNLSSLKKLKFNNTKICTLPQLAMDSLVALTLAKNKISKIPQSLFSLSNIKYLALSDISISANQIEEMCSMKELKCLKLINSSIKNFPKFDCMQNLSVLMLCGNNISSIPFEATILKQLSFLDVSGNPIAENKKFIEELWMKNRNLLIGADTKNEIRALRRLSH